MGLTIGATRREGEKGLNLVELKRALDEAVAKADPELDLTTVFPTVQTTVAGKPLIKKIEVIL